ncbi:MAG: hypothetical protein MMC33_008412 [Icmadophila ericetorum]|nr:hypothetical protein [Icmadophila ericetorum]
MMRMPAKAPRSDTQPIKLMERMSVVDISFPTPILLKEDQLYCLLTSGIPGGPTSTKAGETLGIFQQKIIESVGTVLIEAWNQKTDTHCGAGIFVICSRDSKMGPFANLRTCNLRDFGKMENLAAYFYQELFNFAKAHLETGLTDADKGSQSTPVHDHVPIENISLTTPVGLPCYTLARHSTKGFFTQYGFYQVKKTSLDLAASAHAFENEGWGDYDLLILYRPPGSEDMVGRDEASGLRGKGKSKEKEKT